MLKTIGICEVESHSRLFFLIATTKTDFEDPSNSLGDRRFRISYAGGTETVKQAMTKFHQFWPKWLKMVEDAKK
jgi:hypothetical protein